MNKLDRFRFGNVRRNRIKIGILVSFLVIVLSFIVMVFVGLFSYRSELVTVNITNENSGDSYLGTGINLDYIPSVNLVRDGSFETSTMAYSFPVSDAQGSSVFFKPDDIIRSGINTNLVNGSNIRIVSIDSNGVMSLSYEGEIIGFEAAKLGLVIDIEDKQGVWSDLEIIKTASVQSTVTALTSEGKLITDITSEQLTDVIGGGADFFTDICSNGRSDANVVYALTSDGRVFSSSDGRNYSQTGSITVSEDDKAEEIAAVGTTLLIRLESGKAVILSSTDSRICSVPGGTGISKISACNGSFIVLGQNGNVYISANGIVFRRLYSTSVITRGIVELKSGSSVAYGLTDDSRLIVIDTVNEEIREITSLRDSGLVGVSFTITEKDSPVVVTDDHTAVICSEDLDTVTVVSAENVDFTKVFDGLGNKIVFSSSTGLYSCELLSDFRLSSSVAEDIDVSGNICFVSQKHVDSSLIATEDEWISSSGVWSIYGKGTSAEVYTEDASGGMSCLRVTGIDDGIHVLSQQISSDSTKSFEEDKFYRVSLYLKATDGMTINDVNIWLEGETFGKQGFTVREVDDRFKQYSFVFAVSDTMLEEENIRLNISFENSGMLFVDDVYVGLDSYDDSAIPEYFVKAISEANPSTIRLNNLGFGSTGFSESEFYGMTKLSTGSDFTDPISGESKIVSDSKSLEDSLKIVRDCSATPWFVIGSNISQNQINNLLSYLCGSVSSEYGTLRINNGTALPWSRQFNTIYFEISDTENAFVGDVQRGAYVDYVISMIVQSEYYSEIKDKVIFLDGMQYDGGTMLSSADSHAMNADVKSTATLVFSKSIYNTYNSVAYDSPRITGNNDAGEYISSMSVSGTMNAGKYVSLLLSEEADFIQKVMVDVDVVFEPALYGGDEMFLNYSDVRILINVMSQLSEIEGYADVSTRLVEPLKTDSAQSVERFSRDNGSFMFTKGDKTYLIVANTSKNLQQFLIGNNGTSLKGAEVLRFSSEGELLTRRVYSSAYRRNNLQSGEYMVVIINGKKNK